MPLAHLLYRCPVCGHEPLEGRGSLAGCAACLRAFGPGSGGTRIAVRTGVGELEEVPARALIERIGVYGSPRGSAGAPSFPVEAAATMRVAVRESPIRRRGALLGFCERLGARKVGVLSLYRDRLTFTERSGTMHEWPLGAVRALQGSSSAVQIAPARGGLVSFRLDRDSPKRWDDLLRAQLRAVWRAEGRGEIVEFQPRIQGA